MAEESTFETASIVYHYFEGDKMIELGCTLRDEIADSGKVGPMARCLTEREMRESLDTDNPHYGDGAYVTFHQRLDKAHVKVRRRHGLHVSARKYRAVLRVHMRQRFRRVQQTGGVGLAEPGAGPPTRGDLIFVSPPDVEVIRIERLKQGKWVVA